MATPTTIPRRHLIPLLTLFLFLSTIIATSSASAADNYTDFTFDFFDETQASKLIFQGDAKLSSTSKTIQLTSTDANGNPKKNSVGRVLYSDPVHLWKKSDGVNQVSSFETTFKFVISSTTREIFGDGLTFFFAPVDSTIPDDSDGGFFGLFSNNTLGPAVDVVDSPYHILAVEFDTYIDNRWDPNYDPLYRHIGIDVNTIRSRADIPWDRKSGKEVTTTVSYNTNNKKLYVKASYSEDEFYEVSSSIDMDVVLPEHVRVGFSASTGDSAVENHNIVSWSFSAWLHNVTALAATKDSVEHTSVYFTY